MTQAAKRCAWCAEVKPAELFYMRPGGTPHSYCRACHHSRQRAATRSDVAKALYRSSKANARKRGLEHTITKDDIKVPEVCPVLGFPIRVSDGRMDNQSPSIDRMDSSKGYVPGNIRVISWRANRLKSDTTLAEARAIVRYLESA